LLDYYTQYVYPENIPERGKSTKNEKHL